jgi:hypothetical protein
MPAADVQRTPERPSEYPATIAAARLNLRVGAPVWKRGLYRTVIGNELSVERIGFDYGERRSMEVPLVFVALTRGPSGLNTVQHDMLVSQAIGTKWRVSGVLQHGFYSVGAPSLDAYQAAGGVFVSRVYRPTLQVGVGAVALNVNPWWIPTLRILHVGKRWRSDVLLPRAETWYDVGHGVELGATLRFLGNSWQIPPTTIDTRASAFVGLSRATWTQGSVGPAANIRLGSSGVFSVESGIAQRRMLVEGVAVVPGAVQSQPPSISHIRSRFDQGATPFARMSLRATF